MGTKETNLFKEHLQEIIKQRLGIEVSKFDAWNLFKDITHGTVEYTYNLDNMRFPLAGVGVFEVLKTSPRGRKKEDGWEYVPRYRFYPSTAIDKLLEQILGFKDHEIDVNHYGIFKTDIESDKVKKKLKDSKSKSGVDVRGQPKDEVVFDDSWDEPIISEENGIVKNPSKDDKEVEDTIVWEDNKDIIIDEDVAKDIDFQSVPVEDSNQGDSEDDLSYDILIEEFDDDIY